MTIWFIADTHFRHKNVLDFEHRPFETIEQMEQEMIQAWNNVVSKVDTVYVVGDFCFGTHTAWIEILDQLKGNICLIKGNHDTSKVISRVHNEGYLHEINEVGKILRLNKLSFYLSHFPLEIGERPRYFNISGHIHSKANTFINQLNVGVDSALMHNYYQVANVPFGTPVSFDYLVTCAEVINEQMNETYVRGN